ncbi:MAG TPA: hypothetical protein VLW85_15615, partial [Myxococcales bacterium]|nr:hypothetical protein [Myxococcales bacterium]
MTTLTMQPDERSAQLKSAVLQPTLLRSVNEWIYCCQRLSKRGQAMTRETPRLGAKIRALRRRDQL